MASRPHSTRVPWETVVNTRRIGAREDGGVLWSSGFYAHITLCLPPRDRQTGTFSSLFQLYSLFLTAAAGHLTAGQNSAAAWADAMLAGTQAMKRYGRLKLLFQLLMYI